MPVDAVLEPRELSECVAVRLDEEAVELAEGEVQILINQIQFGGEAE